MSIIVEEPSIDNTPRKVGRPRVFTAEQLHERKLKAMKMWRDAHRDHTHCYNCAEDVKARRRAQYATRKDELNEVKRRRYAEKRDRSVAEVKE